MRIKYRRKQTLKRTKKRAGVEYLLCKTDNLQIMNTIIMMSYLWCISIFIGTGENEER